MTQSLKDEFEASRRWPWRRLAVIPVMGAAVWAAGALWPVSTLRHARVDVSDGQIARPYQDRAFQGAEFASWNWVDTSRRVDMLRVGPKADDVIDVMLWLADGKRFLFHPLTMQGLISTPKGDVFVFKPGWEKYARIARDAAGGPVHDLKPHKVTPLVVVVPVETLKDYVRLHGDGVWRFFLVPDDQGADGNRNSVAMHDAAVALAHRPRRAADRGAGQACVPGQFRRRARAGRTHGAQSAERPRPQQ